jgi:hypothetical protein
VARHSSSRTCFAVLIGEMVIAGFRLAVSTILRMAPSEVEAGQPATVYAEYRAGLSLSWLLDRSVGKTPLVSARPELGEF